MSKGRSIAKIFASAIIMLMFATLAMLGMVFYMSTIFDLTEMHNMAVKYESEMKKELQLKFEKTSHLLGIISTAEDDNGEIEKAIIEAQKQYEIAVSNNNLQEMLDANEVIKTECAKFAKEYPKVSSKDRYRNLMYEYSLNEDVITSAKKKHSEVVGEYNKMVMELPTSIVANNKGFECISELKGYENANDIASIRANRKIFYP